MKAPFDERQLAVLRALQAHWADRNLVLIGASALGCSVEMTWRKTQDLDLALVADAPDAAADLARLGFAQDPRIEHRWRAPSGLPVDILAVTKAQLAAGTLSWPSSGHTMSLLGIDLALRNAFEVPLGEGQGVAVATAAGIAVLKMVAWLDSPADRDRDLMDLGYLLSSYLGNTDMRRWEDARLAETEFDDQGALALGIDVGAIGGASHLEAVTSFVTAVTANGAAFARMSRAGLFGGRDPESGLAARLDLFQRGVGRGSAGS